MTGDQALRDLLDVSEDVVAAVIVGADGAAVAASVDQNAGSRAAGIVAAMLAYADALRSKAEATRLQARTPHGSVFVVRDGDRAAVAATSPAPVAGLVLHDLRAVLRKTRTRSSEKAHA